MLPNVEDRTLAIRLLLRGETKFSQRDRVALRHLIKYIHKGIGIQVWRCMTVVL